MFLGGNGSTLTERLVPKGLSNAATALVDSFKINSISERTRRGRRVVVKRRNAYSEQMADLANLYFRLTGISIRFWSKTKDWQRWEIDCYNMLNGDRFRATASGKRTVIQDKLPGKSIWDHMQKRTLTPRMLKAAAHEFRRAHEFRSAEFRGPWSHGDATTTNVIYNQRTERARLIDFEIIHDKSLSYVARQADDLLVFLLDMVGLVPTQQWLPFALCFIKNYGDRRVIAELKKQLRLPTGLGWIWRGVRTNFTNPTKVRRRLEQLRRAIGQTKPIRQTQTAVTAKAGGLRRIARRARPARRVTTRARAR